MKETEKKEAEQKAQAAQEKQQKLDKINAKEVKKETLTEKASKVQSEAAVDNVSDTGFESEGDILSYGASVINHGFYMKGASPISAGKDEGSLQIEHSSLFDGMEEEIEPVVKQIAAEKKNSELMNSDKKEVKKETLSERASKDEQKHPDLKIDI